jgi:hypothetical protein
VKPDLTEAEHRLLTAYTQAALQLSRELGSFRDPKDVARILQRIDAILAQLDQLSADYIREGLAEQFKIGSAVALYELRKLRLSDLDTDFTGIHLEAVRELARDASLRFGEAIETVRRSATVKLSQASKEAVLQGMMQKELTGADATKAVKSVFAGVTAFRTPNRTIGLEDYADILVRSISAEAHNTGAATRYAANGVEYAQVVERETACAVCSPMNDKFIWLGDPKLRPPYHPRCRGGLIPVPGIPDTAIRSPEDPRVPVLTKQAMMRR